MRKYPPFILIFTVFACLLAGCGGYAANPSEVPSGASEPLESIDNVLESAASGSIAYNAPDSMQLGQSQDLQLILSPADSPDELKKKIVAKGKVVEAELTVTPLMKAELMAQDPEAFTIQPYHATSEQVVLTDAPTEWRWSVTAKKAGEQVLTLTIYRQVKYKGDSYWRMVESYQNKVEITVTAGQRLRSFDWKWLLGVLIPAALIPGFLWVVRRGRERMKQQAKKERK